MSGALAIDVKGLTKRFGKKTAVDHIDIAVPQGEVWGFLGPNGSGKTTTIRMLCGLLSADEGQGTCLGLNFRTQSEAVKRQVGYMTQKFSFWEDLSIRENLEFVARLYGLPDRKAKVDQTLERLGLAKRQDQLAGELSGGWKQRLALAACTLHGPKLLLLDEPTAGVDPKARRDFWEQIHALSDQGLTVRSPPIIWMKPNVATASSNPERQAGGARFGGRSDRTIRPGDLRAGGCACAPSAARTAGQARHRLCRIFWRGPACQRPQPRRP